MRFVGALDLSSGFLTAADRKLGTLLGIKGRMPFGSLLATPADYARQIVQVKRMTGDVCEMIRCWMDLVNPVGQRIRIKINDGEIEVIRDFSAKLAFGEGCQIQGAGMVILN